MVNAFFALETRKARVDLRDNDKFTELKDEDPGILVKREGLPEQEREDVWELVSSYNRLGFVLHDYPIVFLFLSLKTKFLKWDAKGVIDTWKRVRLYVYISFEVTILAFIEIYTNQQNPYKCKIQLPPQLEKLIKIDLTLLHIVNT